MILQKIAWKLFKTRRISQFIFYHFERIKVECREGKIKNEGRSKTGLCLLNVFSYITLNNGGSESDIVFEEEQAITDITGNSVHVDQFEFNFIQAVFYLVNTFMV